MKDTAVARFWAKVRKADGCWVWTACVDTSGYGKLSVGSREFDRAHRISYRLHHGPIPEGLLVLHRCDNRRCVNPAHLFLGSIQDNMRDMVSKERQARGENKWTAVLTAAEVVELRERHADGETLSYLATVYGITNKQASSIACGDSWKHVGGPRRERRKFKNRA